MRTSYVNDGTGCTYMAVVRCAMDEVPLGLYPTRTEAAEALNALTDGGLTDVQNLLGTDASIVLFGAVVEFNQQGQVTGYVMNDLELPRVETE